MIENPLQFKYSIDVCNEAIQFLINQSMGFSIHEFVEHEDDGSQSLSVGDTSKIETIADEYDYSSDNSDLYFEDIISDYTQDEEKETEAEDETGVDEDEDNKSSEYTNEAEGEDGNDIGDEIDELKDNSDSEDGLVYEAYAIESSYEEYNDGEDKTYEIESESEVDAEQYFVDNEESDCYDSDEYDDSEDFEESDFETEESEDLAYELEDNSINYEEDGSDGLAVDSDDFDTSEEDNIELSQHEESGLTGSEDGEYSLTVLEDGEESNDSQEYIESIKETSTIGSETYLEEIESNDTDGDELFVTEGYSVDLDSEEDILYSLEQNNCEVSDTSEKENQAELEEKKKKLAYLKKLLAVKEAQEKEALDKKAVEQANSAGKIYKNTNELYKDVKAFMLSKGVDKKPISSDILTAEFGERNIRELRLKSYIIKIGSGFTIGL